jgi:UTP-glucose-1-phosphate uridylyltransferase
MIENDEEIGFSEFLNEYAQRQDMYAIVIRGESFDLGNPKDYYSSFTEYGKDNV